MLAGRNKFSIRQAYIIVITMTFTPAVRSLPTYAAQEADNAGWISPLITIFSMLILAYIFKRLFLQYPTQSFPQITEDIMGKVLGKSMIFVFLVWLVVLEAFYVRMYAGRILVSMFPEVDMRTFIFAMLFLVWLALRQGLVTIIRMGEMIFYVLILTFFLLAALASLSMNPSTLFPVSYLDIKGILLGSFRINAINAYFVFILILCEFVNNREKTMKLSYQAAGFMSISQSILVAVTFTTIGCSLVYRSPYPFLIVVRNIELYRSFERLESLILATWLAADFILISIFTYCALYLAEKLFKLNDKLNLLPIFLVFIFYFSLYYSQTLFGIDMLAYKILTVVNNIVCFMLPILLFVIAKARGKLKVKANR